MISPNPIYSSIRKVSSIYENECLELFHLKHPQTHKIKYPESSHRRERLWVTYGGGSSFVQRVQRVQPSPGALTQFRPQAQATGSKRATSRLASSGL